MCGISGVFHFGDEAPVAEGLVARMVEAMRHRGPDEQGVWRAPDGRYEVGVARLKIIDLTTGRQPIANEDGSVWIAFNGEVYNFRELRPALEERHRFRTRTDTEVVLHSYQDDPEGFLAKLNGMFGLAVYDVPARRLTLAIDPYGIKPIYYRLANGRLHFASELKCILQDAAVERHIDPVALQHYLAYGYVPAPFSILAGIRKLRPGERLVVTEGGEPRIDRYSRLRFGPPEGRRSSADWAAEVRAALRTAVERQLVSDVPLGAFLSGGIDSSTIVAIMAELSEQPVKTFSIGFPRGEAIHDERPFAAQVAARYGTDHRELEIRSDALNGLPDLAWHLDEPHSDSSTFLTHAISRGAREHVTVALSGAGGDELFAGYRRYLAMKLARTYRRLPGPLRTGLIQPLVSLLPRARDTAAKNTARWLHSFVSFAGEPFREAYYGISKKLTPSPQDGFFSPELERQLAGSDPFAHFDHCFDEAAGADELNQLMYVDLQTYLPHDILMLTDKMSMTCSLEVRVPFLDLELVALAARIPEQVKLPGRQLKHILKLAAAPLLPPEVLTKKKWGFSAPVDHWLKKDLRPVARALLSEEVVARRGLFQPAAVTRLLADFEAGTQDLVEPIYALICLEVWQRVLIDGNPTSPPGVELPALAGL